jgi:hypothetical protein
MSCGAVLGGSETARLCDSTWLAGLELFRGNLRQMAVGLWSNNVRLAVTINQMQIKLCGELCQVGPRFRLLSWPRNQRNRFGRRVLLQLCLAERRVVFPDIIRPDGTKAHQLMSGPTYIHDGSARISLASELSNLPRSQGVLLAPSGWTALVDQMHTDPVTRTPRVPLAQPCVLGNPFFSGQALCRWM